MALEPITRQEQIIAGKNLEPITRMEKFLKEYGGGSGGGSGSSVQADWNQNDSSAADFIKNKPFGDDWVEAMGETEIVGTVADGTVTDGMYGAELTSHGVSLSGDEDQIIVIFDGAEYICDRFYIQDATITFYGNGVHIGMDDTGEPFLIANGTPAGGAVVIIVEDGNTHTVAIKKMGVKKLDEKYLPESTTLVVTFPGDIDKSEESTQPLDKTLDEIYAAYESGRTVVLEAVGKGTGIKLVLPLIAMLDTTLDSKAALFSGVIIMGAQPVYFTFMYMPDDSGNEICSLIQYG